MLTAANVEKVFTDCLFRIDEDTTNAKVIECVVHTFGFNPDRLMPHKEEISSMLNELPDNFKKDIGGGWSFLNACMTKDGIQWGEHKDIEMLLALGIATGLADMLMPRDMWPILPGGMPYFSVSV